MLVLLAAVALADPLETLTDAPGTPDVGVPGAVELPAPQAVINGDRERGYPATVALGFGGQSFCTGSLITPRIVLTAAHCTAEFPDELIVEFVSLYVGTTSANPDEELRISAVHAHPGYVPLSGADLGERDVAVLVLAEDAPMAPVWFRTEALDEDEVVGQTVVSVGFGLDENDDANVKKSATLNISSIDPVFLVSSSNDNRNGANVCSGDSGGPQYHVEADGSLVQWAIHTWADSECRSLSGSTRTDQVSDWILAQVENEHGTRDQCTLFEKYGDGVCDTDCDHPDFDCVTFEMPSPVTTGCATTGATGPAWLALGLVGLLRRRRSGTC